MTEFLEANHDDAWDLIGRYAAGIRNEAFDPEPWEPIYDSVCEECPFNEMCPDYLAEEVTAIE